MSDRSEQAKSIFLEAVDKQAPNQWPAFLGQACGRDPALRAEVERLLRARSELGSFHEAPRPAPAATIDQPAHEAPGTLIGPYKLMEQIGEGGMGLVFVAEQQQPVRRKVALKVVKPGMDTRQVVARFEAERQALALMDHPNIARVFDGGETTSGRPYFVMELVKGVPITEFCDQNQVPIRDRLGLFASVCQAVQHAHQKGVIHRDLKPSNVLVMSQDGAPMVKVIDFGVAKAVGQQLTDKTIYTQFTQLVGTPLYMSPEQAGQSGLDVDTRSDIYALGVLLYELLTGTTPFDKERFRETGYDEMRRIIREEEPPKPSTRISTLGQAATTVSTNRKSDPKQLSRLCSGELDWIVMKCLEKDRERRYESASALADDVGRYLGDQPVQACPPSAWYRFGKLVRRNKNALAIGAVLTAALVVAVVGLAINNISINREKDRTVKALAEKEEALKAADANLLLARQAVDEMYTEVSPELVSVPYMQPFQRDVLQKALRFYEQFAQRQSGDPAIRLETASARLRVGQAQFTLGQHRQGKQACHEALAALEKLGDELPEEPKRRFWLAAAYSLRGAILNWEFRPRQAATSYRQALALYRELAAEQPDIPDHRSRLAATHLLLPTVLSDSPGEAEKEAREGVRLYEKLVAEWPKAISYKEALITSYVAQGNFLAGMERFQEAERAYRQAIDLYDTSAAMLDRTSGRWLRANAECALGAVLAASGQRAEAEQAYRRGIVAAERVADQFPDVPGYRLPLAQSSGKFAALLDQEGKADEAAVYWRSAHNLFEKLAAESPDDEARYGILASAGSCFRDAGDLEAAEEFTRKSVILAAKLAERFTEPYDRRRLAISHGQLGVIWQRRGRPRDAADQFRQGLTIYERLAAAFPDETEYRYQQAKALNFQGRALCSLPGEAADALRRHQQALELCQLLVVEFPDEPAYRIQLVRSHFGRGITLGLAGHPAEAAQAFQKALNAYRPDGGDTGGGVNQLQFASVHNELAWLLATWPDAKYRDASRAVELATKAVKLAPKKPEYWNTLGVAHYRAGHWNLSIAALDKALALPSGRHESYNTYFLAMAYWKLGEKEQARTFYDRAVRWMEKNDPRSGELQSFRAEAAELLGVLAPSEPRP